MNDLPVAELIAAAEKILGAFELREPDFTAGEVAAALESESGKIYTGICIDLTCGIGFCAEHSAIAEMLKHRESHIRSIVAINQNGILPPCGRCREMIAQLNAKNAETAVILGQNRSVPLKDLLPEYWL